MLSSLLPSHNLRAVDMALCSVAMVSIIGCCLTVDVIYASININATKSVQVTFTLRKEQCPIVYINNTVIAQSQQQSTLAYIWIPG
jgi:hypothetical protein